MDQLQSDITNCLHALQGEPRSQASSARFERRYDALRRMARGHLRRESSGHTLSATGLAHEAWFRMDAQSGTHWQQRNHFPAVASTMMPRFLVNHDLARELATR